MRRCIAVAPLAHGASAIGATQKVSSEAQATAAWKVICTLNQQAPAALREEAKLMEIYFAVLSVWWDDARTPPVH